MAGRLGGDESGGVYFGPPAEPFPGTDAAAKVQEAAEAAIRYNTQHTRNGNACMEIIDHAMEAYPLLTPSLCAFC
jgi:hypothetical protein